MGLAKRIKEIDKKIESLKKEKEWLQEKRDEKMKHHHQFHVGSNNKYCPECGMQLTDRCPKFMRLGRDCNEMGCPYFEKKVRSYSC